MKNNKILTWTAYVLVLIGAINWGLLGFSQLIGISNIDLVKIIFSNGVISNLIYIIVGISGIYLIFNTKNLK